MSGKITGEQRVNIFPIAKELANELKNHTDFGIIADKFVPWSAGGGGGPVSPYFAVNLLHVLESDGIDRCAHWFEKIIHLKSAEVAQVQLIHGVKVNAKSAARQAWPRRLRACRRGVGV